MATHAPPTAPAHGDRPALEHWAQLLESQAQETQIWEELSRRRATQRLSRDEFIALLQVEDSLKIRAGDLAVAERAMRREQALTQAAAAAAHHDRLAPAVKEAVLAVVHSINAVFGTIAQLEHLLDQQTEKLQALPGPRGEPAFASLGSSRTVVQTLLGSLPSSGMVEAFLHFPAKPVTLQREMDACLDTVKGARPVSETTMVTYLKGFHDG
jgi:hypothetical protein